MAWRSGLFGIEVLHPDGRALAERVDAIVIVHRRVAEHRAPEAEVDRLGPGCDCQLNLLDGASVRGGTVLARDGRDGPGNLDVPGFGPHISLVSFTVRRSEAAVSRVRRLESRHIGHRSRQPRRLPQASHA